MRVSRYVLPALVVAFLFGGYFLRLGLTLPTTAVAFDGEGQATVTCVVDGLKCKGTARFFTKLYEGRAGIASIETFATEHQAVFTYDPASISMEEIAAIMEAPVPLRDGRLVQPFRLVETRGAR